MGPRGRGPRGTNQDPEDFPALDSPAGSSTDLPDYEDAVVDQKMDVEQGRETPADNFWSNCIPALMKNSNNYKVKLKFHLFWFIKNALFKLLIDSFQQKLLKLNGSKDSNGGTVFLWCRASQDVEDKQLSIFESIRIQQFWPFRFSNSSEEESRIRPLFKVKIFVALNTWQDYISEIWIKEIAILRIVVLIKFTSLLKTHFSLAVAGAWFPEVQTLSSSSSSALASSSSSSSSGAASSSGLPLVLRHSVLRTNMNVSSININSFFASPSCLEVGEPAALSIGGWRIVATTLKTYCNKISFSFIKFKFKFKFDVLSLLSTSLVDAFVLMGGKIQKFSSPNLFSLSLDDPEFAFQTWTTRTMPTLGLWSRTASLKTTVHCWVEFFVQFSVKLIIIFQELSAELFTSLFLLDNLGK